ncbi:hypothetical protein J4418_01900 [Candidatus Woesearchaeota archaeon]|nr:hypothetical protein [Candidatus Woesearchaeota archaeon]
MVSSDVKDLIQKYQKRIISQIGSKAQTESIESIEYLQFRKEMMPKRMSFYEKVCNISEKIIQISPDQKSLAALEENIKIAHLNVTPSGVVSFSVLGPILLMFIGSLMGYLFTALFLPEPSFFLVFVFLILGVILMFILNKIPEYFADDWRVKASNQMIIGVFYIVTYMRHTSNLEGAIKFASDYLTQPLSLDFKRLIWNVETGVYSSIKESLDTYLESWRKWNTEFIESMHLIEGSLYEGTEVRRLALLDKSLEVILEGTYEKMLHFAHSLQSPITMLHMLGVILPILGLVILPLIVSFMTTGSVAPTTLAMYIATLYNFILPVGVFYLGKSILANRPTGYGDSDIAETSPELQKYRNILIRLGKFEMSINPLFISLIIGIGFFIIGISPLIFHAFGFADIGFLDEDTTSSCGSTFCLLEYRESSADKGPLVGLSFGPYGIGAAILSIAIVIAFGFGIGTYYQFISKNVIEIREKSKLLEKEFASALFQLGNRLGDGLPMEVAFGKVSESMKGTFSGDFMNIVSNNITRLGMSVENAIFDSKVGAIIKYPSNMIKSSMKVLTQATSKGPKVAAQTLVNISQYIKEIHKVDERLRDLMAEIVSSMNSQIKFMAPVIAGIVIGITSMVTTILGKLTFLMDKVSSGSGMAGLKGLEGIKELLGDGMPTYYFQIIVGLYIIQIIYILSILVNTIENGSDKLAERYVLGKNLIRGTILYSGLAFVVILVFNFIAASILKNIAIG